MASGQWPVPTLHLELSSSSSPLAGGHQLLMTFRRQESLGSRLIKVISSSCRALWPLPKPKAYPNLSPQPPTPIHSFIRFWRSWSSRGHSWRYMAQGLMRAIWPGPGLGPGIGHGRGSSAESRTRQAARGMGCCTWRKSDISGA